MSLKWHIGQHDADIFLGDVLFLVEVVPTNKHLINLHFIRQLHFFFQGREEHVLKSSYKRFLENEVVLGAFKSAEEAIADDSW
jgi:hypothetical protein